jgi:DNA-binding PadR family transcriptional regulator
MAGRFRRSNPLALAVLALLWEREMHPYEMAATLRQRHKEDSIKLRYGSLYTVVETLHRNELITEVESRRDGRRPERTVYRLTEAGQEELDDWLRDLIAVPAKEFRQFEAGLSLAAVLPPDDVVALLVDRGAHLDRQIASTTAALAALSQDLPALVLVEAEFQLAMARAERAWVAGFADAIRNNAIEGVEWWRKRAKQARRES